MWWITLLFGHKNDAKPQVDFGELKEEKERLTSFLKAALKVEVTPSQDKLTVESEKIPAAELQRVVTKFIYKRNLNGSHWVSLDGNTVKINTFEGAKKKKSEKNKKGAAHATLPQSWGL